MINWGSKDRRHREETSRNVLDKNRGLKEDGLATGITTRAGVL